MSGTGLKQRISNKLSKKIGQEIFLSAQRDLVSGELEKPRKLSVVVHLLSLAILASPIICALAGLLLISVDFPNLLTLVVGVILVALGIALRPRRAKMPEKVKRRDELPATFALADAISSEMSAPQITGVSIEPDMNGFMGQYGSERILGIGAILWSSATDEERVAFVAHEIAHAVNGDPARRKFPAMASETLDEWLWYLADDGADYLAAIMLFPFRAVAEALYVLHLRLIYLESQRAEYLADAIGAKVSGRQASQRLLAKTVLAPLIEKKLLGMHARRSPGGQQMILNLAGAVLNPDPEEEDRLNKQMQSEMLSVDATHPPTVYRKAFLELVPDGNFENDAILSLVGAADHELVPLFSNAGDEILKMIDEDA